MFSRLLLLFSFLFSLNILASAIDYVPGEVIVKLKDPSREINLFNMALKDDFKILKNLKVYSFPEEVDINELIDSLEKDPNVVYAEPNYIIKVEDDSEPFYGEPIELNTPLNPLSSSNDIIVAVLDSGIDYKHRALRNSMWVNTAEEMGEPGVDDDNNGYIDDVYGMDFAYKDSDPMDKVGHGTHCAGIVLSARDKEILPSVLSGNIKIMAVKFLDNKVSGEIVDAIKAVEYAVTNGARILSNSWGHGASSEALLDAFKMAEEKGVLSTAAAGNRADNLEFKTYIPGGMDLDSIITVASVEKNGYLAKYSGYGRKTVDIATYGTRIKSTLPGNRYGRKTGTSMATPLVSGTAAMILANNPSLSIYEVKKRILDGAEKLKSLKNRLVSHGKLNIYNAINGIKEEIPWPVYNESQWVRYEKQLSSEHPYPIDADIEYKIRHRGAKAIRVHFSKADLEGRNDFLKIKDPRGHVYDEIIYEFEDGVLSNEVDGDTLIINLVSDVSYSFYGFDVDYYEVIE